MCVCRRRVGCGEVLQQMLLCQGVVGASTRYVRVCGQLTPHQAFTQTQTVSDSVSFPALCPDSVVKWHHSDRLTQQHGHHPFCARVDALQHPVRERRQQGQACNQRQLQEAGDTQQRGL